MTAKFLFNLNIHFLTVFLGRKFPFLEFSGLVYMNYFEIICWPWRVLKWRSRFEEHLFPFAPRTLPVFSHWLDTLGLLSLMTSQGLALVLRLFWLS
jgi:hypothetical protein